MLNRADELSVVRLFIQTGSNCDKKFLKRELANVNDQFVVYMMSLMNVNNHIAR